jgi:DNA excision repair protein ERCC-5
MPTVSTEEKPDARLATEEELKQFIDDMHPSDIDIESAEFRALPTEVQYEIIGDLRIRSRQQSHKRLADMLRAAPTALDFSKAQIKHLSQRNALTQQLLTVTDMVGSAHLTIPVRIAAERNREYVLVKRGEEAGGGWALGIREGTKAKPIVVEPDLNAKLEREFSVEDEDETNNSGIEEVLDPRATMDTDLREHRRREILEAITARYAPKRPSRASLDIPVQPFGASRAPGAMPLFATDEEEEVLPTANDEALALALQQEELGSDEVVPDEDLARALAMSRRKAEVGEVHEKERALVEVEAASQDTAGEKSDDSVEEMEEVSLVPSERTTPAPVSKEPSPEEDEDFVEVVPSPTRPVAAAMSAQSVESSSKDIMPFLTVPPARDLAAVAIASSSSAVSIARRSDDATRCQVLDDLAEPFSVDDDANDELRLASARFHFSSSTTPSRADVAPTIQSQPRRPLLSHRPFRPSPLSSGQVTPAADPEPDSVPSSPLQAARISPSPPSPPLPPLSLVAHEPERMIDEALASGSRSASGTPFSERRFTDDDDSAYRVPTDDDDDEDVDRLEWSRSPSPVRKPRPPLAPEISADSIPSEVDNEVEEDEGEMAREDMVAEEDDYARFMAQIKNRDLNEVRTEIDDEIRVLNSAKKVAMRDSDEITQGMIAQIQTLLRHFGIPYITAPMEAEAQCAKLAELGLVDGIITDDSDVFLFGGIQCFKNIFNDAKYAECFVLSDVERELSLTRERLISLAYLLGSDYTIGLPGVGPVVALELLANFPGPTGIDDFKTWWTKVQRGQDTSEETNTKWKASFVRDSERDRSIQLMRSRRRGIRRRSSSLQTGQIRSLCVNDAASGTTD